MQYDIDIFAASRKLSELDFKFSANGLKISINWFRVMQNKEQWEIEKHKHSSFEFHFIASGACRIITEEDSFDAYEGQFYLTAPGVFHHQKYFPGSDHIEYSLNCSLEADEDADAETCNILNVLSSCPCKPLDDLFGCMDIFYRCLAEAYNGYQGFYTSIKNYISLIIINSARAITEQIKMPDGLMKTYSPPKKTDLDEFRFTQIEKFIIDNISTTISVSTISSFMHLSPKQVCRIISKKSGMSTKEFINCHKLKVSKHLLKNPELSIKDISALLGFSSEYYFNQFFKRLEGYPPSKYRKDINNK